MKQMSGYVVLGLDELIPWLLDNDAACLEDFPGDPRAKEWQAQHDAEKPRTK